MHTQINGDGRLRHRRTTNVSTEVMTSDKNDDRVMVNFRKMIFVKIIKQISLPNHDIVIVD
jgi:hypothetical protein